MFCSYCGENILYYLICLTPGWGQGHCVPPHWLASAWWDRARKTRPPLPASRDQGSVLLTGVQQVLLGPKGTQITFGFLGWKPTHVHAKRVFVGILGAVVHKPTQRTTPKALHLLWRNWWGFNQLWNTERLLSCSWVLTDFMDGDRTGSSCWSFPHSRPYFQMMEGLSPLTENIISSQGSNQGGKYINKHSVNLNIGN